MIAVVVAAAVLFAGGCWVAFTVVFPAPVSIAAAIGRLQRPTVNPAGSGRLAGRVGRLVARSGALTADLAVTATTVEAFTTRTAVAVLAAAFAVPAATAGLAAVGVVGWLIPAVVLPAGAAAGAVVPLVVLRADARAARRDLRHALSAWLDVVALLISSGIGPDTAMRDSARAGDGPAFAVLQRAVVEAGFGANLWDVFEREGSRLAVVELRELAAIATLSTVTGASIRDAVVTKARSLRAVLQTEQEQAAARRGRLLALPTVAIGVALIIYLFYPFLTRISIP